MSNNKFKIKMNVPTHAVFLGRTGFGKSTLLERCVTQLFEQGWKVIDIYDADRLENAFYSLPSSYPIWNYLKDQNGKVLGGKSYPTRVLIPNSSKAPKILPECFQRFTIPVHTLEFADLQVLLGSEISQNIVNIFNVAISKLNYDNNFADFLHMMNTMPNKQYLIDESGLRLKPPTKRQLSDIVLAFHNFIREKILSSGRNPLALDLEIEINKKEILSLSTKFIDDSTYKLFVMNYIIRKVYQLCKNNRIKKFKGVILVIREVPDLLPRYSIDRSEIVVRNQISKILKQGRGVGISFFADAQQPSQISDIAKSQFGYVFIARMDDTRDLIEIMTERAKHNLSVEEKRRIEELPNHHFTIITPDDIYADHEAVPPRSKHRDYNEDFFVEWRRHGGKFKDWTKEIQYCNDEFKEGVKSYNIKFEEERIEEESRKKPDYHKSIPIELIKMKQFTRSDVQKVIGIQEAMARTYLIEWREKGVVVKVHSGGRGMPHYRFT